MKIFTLLLLALFYSCGGDSDGYSSSDDGGPNNEQEENQPTDGTYAAVLSNLNPNVPGAALALAQGNVQIQIITDVFDVSVQGEELLQGPHEQHIYMGRACPTLSEDDANNDGFVDAQEASRKLGEILIPLDSDIQSQSLGAGNYPEADVDGLYIYRELGSAGQMIVDLHQTDNNPNDGIGKLPESETFNLDGRVVVIHGYAEATILPDTVATNRGLEANESIPVACGVIRRQ